MRIVVNNIAASTGGALSILKSFYKYLVREEANKSIEWIFLLSNNYIEETDNIKIIILDEVKSSWVKRLQFDLYEGKKMISILKPDVVFSMQNTIIYGLECPQVLYMHQSLPFQNIKKFSFFKSEERNLAIYQRIIGEIIKNSIKKADKTIVQTKWIKEAVKEKTKLSQNKIYDVFPPTEKIKKYKKNNMFKSDHFFYPATDYIYKNQQCIVNACNILNDNKILDFKVMLTIKRKIKNNSICSLGNIPYEEVMEKYNTSTLIFPSYIETLGLPLLEARDLNSIILVADCHYSREVLKNYNNAYFFDPFKPEELAKLMEKVINGSIVRMENYKLENDTLNSWDKVKNIILSVS